jgi:carbon storage regulator
MLVLSRKLKQTIVINGNIRVMVVEIHGGQVRLGIDAPHSVRILREELCGRANGAVRLSEEASARMAGGSVAG